MDTIKGKPFRDQQNDARLKKLQRNLKLNQIKSRQRSQVASSHMSISCLSSIHDDNAMSDLSYCSSSVGPARAGSVVIASSNNFKKKISNSPKPSSKTRPITSPLLESTFDSRKVKEDRVMMPPPSVINRHKPPLLSGFAHDERAANSITKTSILQSNDLKLEDNLTKDVLQNKFDVLAVNRTLDDGSRHDLLKQNGRTFKKWSVGLNNYGEIIIRGKLESGEQARSKAVKKRLNANIVVSIHGHKYRLLGDIHDVREELPEYIRGKFFNGFPTDWENVREIWKGYISSGYSMQFRWPRPVADSDDDLISDITDFTVICKNNSKSKSISHVTTPRPSQASEEMEKSSRTKEIRSRRKKIIEDSDISLAYSKSSENFNATAKSIASEVGGRKLEARTEPVIDHCLDLKNHGTNDNVQSTKIQNKELPSCEKFIPRWKVDIIIDNLMNNKYCCKEYIEKIITAIDCINELVVMSPTNNAKTAPDKSFSVQEHTKSRIETKNDQTTSNTPKPGISRNNISSMTHRGQSPTNSYSIDNWTESEEEQTSNHHTFVAERVATLGKNNVYKSANSQECTNTTLTAQNLQNYPNVMNASHSGSSSIKLKTTRPVRHSHHETSIQSGQYAKHLFLNETDSDFDDGVNLTNKETTAANRTTATVRNSQITLSSSPKPVPSRLNNGPENIVRATQYDSDISIVASQTIPNADCRLSSNENISEDQNVQNDQQRKKLRSFSKFMENESKVQTEVNSSVPYRSSNLMNEKDEGMDLSSKPLMNHCTVELNKIPIIEQNVGGTNSVPTKTRKAQSGNWKPKIDMDDEINTTLKNDSENVSMRMSSRGRRIVPPLDYWNGERVSLKGQELVYSPSTYRAASLSANSSTMKRSFLSANTTAVSEPTPVLTSLKISLDQASLCENTDVKPVNRNFCGHPSVLTEITSNNDEAMTFKKRLKRESQNEMLKIVKKNRKTRSVRENSDTSGDDEKIKTVSNWKRRKIK